jgi:hydroxymethylglutaryl-CoA lyase
MSLPKQVTLVEVSPRDGLQNESVFIPTDIKIQFIEQLAQSGLKHIELTSLVSPQWIPQLADQVEVIQKTKIFPGVDYSVLVPNEHGYAQAQNLKVKHIAVFTAASDTFCQKNINRTLAQSLIDYEKIVKDAKAKKLHVRGYISCALGCPYEGKITPEAVLDVAQQLLAMGCDELSIGDTIGVGTVHGVRILCELLLKHIPVDQLAVHFHDTYGQALANIYAALQLGIHIVDASVAGLGGCPYAKGASGNVATEDVLYMLNGLGIETGVSMEKLLAADRFICQHLNRPSRSKVANAVL